MRAPVALALALLLAGCASPSEQAGDDVAAGLADAADAPDDVRAIEALPVLRFSAGDFNQTLTYGGSFPNPDPCLVEAGGQCEAGMLVHDLTPQVPAQAPVELAVTLTTDACADAAVELRAGEQVRRVGLAGIVVRQPDQQVVLTIRNCSLLGGDPTGSEVPVDAEVRTVVRGDVVPAGLPVALRLADGDRVQAEGDTQELVLYPPGRDPLRLEAGRGGRIDFQVADGQPAGDYVAIARGKGGLTLRGTAGPLVALPVQTIVGDPQPVPDGQELSWELAVPGIPLGAGIGLRTVESPVTGGQPGAHLGDYRLSITQGATEIMAYSETCLGFCSLGAGGSSSRSYPSDYVPKGLGLGPLTGHMSPTPSSGYEAYLYAVYVAA